MKSKVVETNVAIEYLRGRNQETTDKINELFKQGHVLKITQITACELWYGVYNLSSTEKQLIETEKLNKFFAKLPHILTLNDEASKIFGELCAKLDKKGKRVPQFDLLNASIAISNRIRLITKDKRHFPRINELSDFDFLELWVNK